MNLLKSGTSLDGMSKEDVLYNDYKLFTVNSTRLSWSFNSKAKE